MTGDPHLFHDFSFWARSTPVPKHDLEWKGPSRRCCYRMRGILGHTPSEAGEYTVCVYSVCLYPVGVHPVGVHPVGEHQVSCSAPEQN